MSNPLGNKKLVELAQKTPEQRKADRQARIDSKLLEITKRKIEGYKRGMASVIERVEHQREIAIKAGLVPRSAPASKPRRRGMKR